PSNPSTLEILRMKFEIQSDVGQATAGAGGTVVFSFLPGYRYKSATHRLTAASSAITVNYPGDWRLKVNGNTQRQMTHTQLDELNRLNNEPSATVGTAATTRYTMTVPTAT